VRIALTGGTGFLGRYLLRGAVQAGHSVRAWTRRPTTDMPTLAGVEWCAGALGDAPACRPLVAGCDAVVHAALHHPGGGYRRASAGSLLEFVQVNVLGTLQLIEAARAAGVPRFVFISTCAVHERILDDRPLDEAHPLWPTSHYGAHKAAIEKFVHSFGLGDGYAICSLRPTGIYGLAVPPAASKWFDLVHAVARGDAVRVERGGKEVHAADVAAAVELLLRAPAEQIAGQAFNCCDRYVSEYDVAHLAQRLSGARGHIDGEPKRPRHEIDTRKLRGLGMRFGGEDLLRRTIEELLAA
jgi:nucleoside-diphosphate-sugar epimerase